MSQFNGLTARGASDYHPADPGEVRATRAIEHVLYRLEQLVVDAEDRLRHVQAIEARFASPPPPSGAAIGAGSPVQDNAGKPSMPPYLDRFGRMLDRMQDHLANQHAVLTRLDDLV